MKILVTGCSGMLGTAVMEQLSSSGHEAVGIDVRHQDPRLRVDLSDWQALKQLSHWKDSGLVLHLAAATNVDQCETEPDFAYRVNTVATESVARLCAERDIPLVYISTAAVFGGNPKKDPYTEFDDPAPVSVYARSKLQGESAVRQASTKHFIVRASWMMGGLSEEKKFVGKIVQQIKDGQKKLLAVSDKRGCITYTVDFARNLMSLVDSGRYGTYHMVNQGVCTRYDVAKAIVEALGADTAVEAVTSSRFPLPAHRPDSEALRNCKLQLLGLDQMPPWRESLEAYLRALTAEARR